MSVAAKNKPLPAETADRALARAWIDVLSQHTLGCQAFSIGSAPAGAPGPGRNPKDVGEGLREILRRVDHEDHHVRGFWRSYAGALALFVRKHDEMAPIVQNLRTLDYQDTPRRSFLDPLTEVGLSDVLHLVQNGLYDDSWMALYIGQDGDRRLVNEAVDEANLLGKEPNEKTVKNLDKTMGWLRGAEKRYRLNPAVFEREFLSKLTAEDLAVPSVSELDEMWAGRPYADFTGRTPSL